jgi:hypothetical protein
MFRGVDVRSRAFSRTRSRRPRTPTRRMDISPRELSESFHIRGDQRDFAAMGIRLSINVRVQTFVVLPFVR